MTRPLTVTFLQTSLLVAFATSAVAQEPPLDLATEAPVSVGSWSRLDNGVRWRADPVEGVEEVAVWVRFEFGPVHDSPSEAGLAHVLAEVLRGEVDGFADAMPRELTVHDRAVLLGVLMPVDDLTRYLEWLAGLLRGESTLSDDDWIRARDRALLRADDELSVLPGPMLRGRARRTMLAGTPADRCFAGLPAVIAELQVDAIRAVASQRFATVAVSCNAIGQLDVDAFGRAIGSTLGAVPERSATPLPEQVGAAGPSFEAIEPHRTVEAPFVLVATRAPAPDTPDFMPFALALEIARARAAQTFLVLRGSEMRAEFPPVAFDYPLAPALAFIERRGRDGDSLDDTRAELRSFLAGLRLGASDVEIQTALTSLLRGLAMPPYRRPDDLRALASYPVLLLQRGRVVALHDLHGWPEDFTTRIGGVPIGAVKRALAAVFADDTVQWFGLLPETR